MSHLHRRIAVTVGFLILLVGAAAAGQRYGENSVEIVYPAVCQETLDVSDGLLGDQQEMIALTGGVLSGKSMLLFQVHPSLESFLSAVTELQDRRAGAADLLEECVEALAEL